MGRGKLILIEGLDRTGKSTQAGKLTERLGPDSQLIKFPDRSTKIGGLINQYLTDPSFLLPDQAIHLLFSANRWEVAEEIKALLLEGRNVVLDRYVYSGVAYSAAKGVPGMDLRWCLQSDVGLLKPDLTLFLTNQGSELRQGFGDERYENSAFQQKVREQFSTFFNDFEDPDYSQAHIKVLETSGKSIEQVHDMVWSTTSAFMQEYADIQDFMYF
ncbi:bifunctional thymidylate/uridylate kinase [Lachancea thermotolerans CBS 6340]|uniref:Thymidylate kinase n=1 Tax=Lachancea thermotolerans (strain ATCC 56472 / CBS 6340 / NRRL Y-8284) TaxID=559295 RepID=C5DDP8_LACTC|nr:KLTH0C02728p [Lachancea thermotolerans CBS 6340]CAR21909.1 KLTH0C02728p [Lachancea thermotolerans CBS 6340]